MGPIQSSLNQLTLGFLGALGGVAKGFKGGFNEPKAPEESKSKVKPAKVETTKKAQFAYESPKTSEYAAFAAQSSGNDMIKQKALSSQVKLKLASIRKRKGK